MSNGDQADSLEAARKDSAAAEDPTLSSSCPDSALTWIEIILEDDEGNRVPDTEYLVTASDDSEHSGVLDEEGFARVDGIQPGACRVSFPLLEDDDWDAK
jgi:hypothetical protein